MQVLPGPSLPAYPQIFASLPGNFLVLSPQLLVLAASNNFLQQAGLTKQAIMGLPVSNLYGQHASEVILAQMQAWHNSLDYLLANKTPHTMPLEPGIFGDAGTPATPVFWEAINSPVFSESGELIYLIHEVKDITAIKLTSEALRESQERFDMVTLATNDAIWDWNLRENTITWNNAFKTLFGFEDPDPTINSWYDHIHPDDRDRVINSIHQIIDQHHQFWSDEYRFGCADGSFSDIIDRGYLLYDEDGIPYRMVGAMQDITLQKKADQQLQEQADFFEFLANAVPAFIWTTDANAVTNYRNEYYLKFIGHSVANRPGFHWADLLPPEEKDAIVADWQQSIAAGRYFEKEMRIRSQTGEYRWVHIRLNPQLNAQGKILKWLGAATEIHNTKLAQLALEESYQRFKLLADSVPALIWTSNPDGFTDYRNQSYYNFVGAEAANDPNFDWREPLHPDDRAQTYNLWLESVRTGQLFEIEHRLKSKTGEYKWLLSRATAMYDNNGRITKWLGTSTDIEAQKRTQQQLQQRDNQLQSMLKDAPVLFLLLTGYNLICTFTNPNFNKLFNKRQFTNLPAHEAWPELIEQGLLQIWEKVYQTGKPFKADEFPIHYDAAGDKKLKTGFFNLIFQPLYGIGNDHIEGVTCFLVDVTEQVQSKNRAQALAEELRHETDKFKFLAETVPQMIWTTDPYGYHEYFNNRWIEYTGYSLEESQGTEAWNDFLHPDDQARARQVWVHALQTGEDYQVEYRFRRAADGMWRWFLGRAKPMRNQAGQITKWVGTCTDINDQKVAQQNLQEANAELKRINEDLDRFVYTASHDLKLPIINMGSLFGEIVGSRQFTDPDLEKLIQLFYKSLDQINATITDLSEITKVQKNINAEKEKINLAELTNEVCLSIQDQIQGAAAQIKTDFTAVTHLNFSRSNLRSILYNLVSNAIKYCSPHRVPEIYISTAIEPEYFVLTVKDNGLGINLAQHKEKLFQMFKRFHSHVPGTGLGLYMVNRIMQNNHGHILVDSHLDAGSTFRIYFRKD